VDHGAIEYADHQKFTVTDILDFFKDVYFPHLVLLDYTLRSDQQEIVLYTHAPSDLNTIKSLADQFQVVYNDDTPASLAASIERINFAFKKYVDEGRVHEILKKDDQNTPLFQLIWNREYDNLKREPDEKSPQRYGKPYGIYFIHGHDYILL
jgi:hypothetical protein